MDKKDYSDQVKEDYTKKIMLTRMKKNILRREKKIKLPRQRRKCEEDMRKVENCLRTKTRDPDKSTPFCPHRRWRRRVMRATKKKP